ncbi:Uncharacterised protein [Kingella potus]|uniref:Lipoprotein n=1 Tax=Kingella potus TaxID=265175 RepID=A0A377R1N0_9NEIS|nr:cytochrome C [Kingella potus]UOP00118.1 cytochrome C [Kingella potus]STR02828.1 Uncharacterised protein [Kingella potus]
MKQASVLCAVLVLAAASAHAGKLSCGKESVREYASVTKCSYPGTSLVDAYAAVRAAGHTTNHMPQTLPANNTKRRIDEETAVVTKWQGRQKVSVCEESNAEYCVILKQSKGRVAIELFGTSP